MRKNKYIGLSAFILIVSFVMASKTNGVLAATNPTGLTVSPAFQQITVVADESEHPVTFRVTNDKNVPQTISLSPADFNTLNESGGLFFVGTNPTALQKKYGLAKWLSIPQKLITIAPKQTSIINANILNLPDMAGGGHYGALMIRIVDSRSKQTGNNNISIDPIASSLMFVTKIGGDTHRLSLASVNFKHNLFKVPQSVSLMFSDTGNTHVVPRGIVKVTDSDGKLMRQGTINEDSGIVLPQTNRNYTVNLRQISTSSIPGDYKLSVYFRFDGEDQVRGYQTSFWYIPLQLIVAAVLVVFAASLAIYWFAPWRHRSSKQN